MSDRDIMWVENGCRINTFHWNALWVCRYLGFFVMCLVADLKKEIG